MRILVTGGCGYIGSHTVVELLENGYDVVIYDNLSNSSREVINRIYRITHKRPEFVNGDICSKTQLKHLFNKYKFDCVINFAGLKAVGESVRIPLDYYQNNISGAVTLLQVMKEFECFNFIFSSSATVYGDPKIVPVDEASPIGGTTNPYGTTKLYIEQILRDLYASDNRFNIAILRYFNPIGAHKSGLIGEDPNGIPNNLAPYITQVMVGKREMLTIFGNDYDTKDGTCIRDYIHVSDLASAHILALEKLRQQNVSCIYNLGNGTGFSVKEVIDTAEVVTNIKIEREIAQRRAGDAAYLVASSKKARQELGWVPQYTNLEDIIRTAWNWHKNKRY